MWDNSINQRRLVRLTLQMKFAQIWKEVQPIRPSPAGSSPEEPRSSGRGQHQVERQGQAGVVAGGGFHCTLKQHSAGEPGRPSWKTYPETEGETWAAAAGRPWAAAGRGPLQWTVQASSHPLLAASGMGAGWAGLGQSTSGQSGRPAGAAAPGRRGHCAHQTGRRAAACKPAVGGRPAGWKSWGVAGRTSRQTAAPGAAVRRPSSVATLPPFAAAVVAAAWCAGRSSPPGDVVSAGPGRPCPQP